MLVTTTKPPPAAQRPSRFSRCLPVVYLRPSVFIRGSMQFVGQGAHKARGPGSTAPRRTRFAGALATPPDRP